MIFYAFCGCTAIEIFVVVVVTFVQADVIVNAVYVSTTTGNANRYEVEVLRVK